MSATIWLVIEYDYDSSYVRSAYTSESLARQHADEMGFHCESVELSKQLPVEVTDPAAIQARIEERERAIQELKREQEIQKQQAIRRREITITDFGNPGLCHCQVFSQDPMWNEHGYCTYCGGFSPAVFRETRGEAKLVEYIAKLNEWDRKKMNDICFPANTPSVEG